MYYDLFVLHEMFIDFNLCLQKGGIVFLFSKMLVAAPNRKSFFFIDFFSYFYVKNFNNMECNDLAISVDSVLVR